MNETFSYSSPEWRALRERRLELDGHRCSVGRLLGGPCSDGPLHVHHIATVEDLPELALEIDNTASVCASHHPMLEAVCALIRIVRMMDMPPCNHSHPYREGRRQCEERRRRDLIAKRAQRLSREPIEPKQLSLV